MPIPPPSPRAPGGARCSSCSQLLSAAEGKRCGPRARPIAAPEAMVCADHDALRTGATPRRLPIGPVFEVTDAALLPVIAAEDTPAGRDALLRIVEDVEFRHLADLTFVAHVAAWQLAQLGERRAFRHLDSLRTTPSEAAPVERFAMETEVFGAIVGNADTAPGRSASFIDSLTIPGRLLVLAGLLVGGGVFFASYLFVDESTTLPRIPVVALTLPAAVAAALFVRLGIALLRCFGIAFRRS